MCKVSGLGLAGLMATVTAVAGLPDGFVYLSDIDPTIIADVRYATEQNFLGRPIAGYKANKVICTRQAAEHLKEANTYFKQYGYTLVVYDGFRPQMAVDEFRHWGDALKDTVGKAHYYPDFNKSEIFEHGYVANFRSSHTRGSTFDLTLIKTGNKLKPIVYSQRMLQNGQVIPFLDDGTVDMGSSFDLFHAVSGHDSPLVTEPYTQIRNFLRQGMIASGFEQYPEEWWHYTLANEPYPDTYFNFVMS